MRMRAKRHRKVTDKAPWDGILGGHRLEDSEASEKQSDCHGEGCVGDSCLGRGYQLGASEEMAERMEALSLKDERMVCRRRRE